MMIYTNYCTTFSACSIYEVIDISIADGIPAGFEQELAYTDKNITSWEMNCSKSIALKVTNPLVRELLLQGPLHRLR